MWGSRTCRLLNSSSSRRSMKPTRLPQTCRAEDIHDVCTSMTWTYNPATMLQNLSASACPVPMLSGGNGHELSHSIGLSNCICLMSQNHCFITHCQMSGTTGHKAVLYGNWIDMIQLLQRSELLGQTSPSLQHRRHGCRLPHWSFTNYKILSRPAQN